MLNIEKLTWNVVFVKSLECLKEFHVTQQFQRWAPVIFYHFTTPGRIWFPKTHRVSVKIMKLSSFKEASVFQNHFLTLLYNKNEKKNMILKCDFRVNLINWQNTIELTS